MRYYYDAEDCAAIRCLSLNVHDQIYGWWPGRAAMSCAAMLCARVAWRWRRPWMASWYFQIKRSPGHAGRRGASSGARAVAWLFWKSGGRAGCGGMAGRRCACSFATSLRAVAGQCRSGTAPVPVVRAHSRRSKSGLAGNHPVCAATCVVRQVAGPVNVLAGQQPGGLTLYLACFYVRIDSKAVISMGCGAIYLAHSLSRALSLSLSLSLSRARSHLILMRV